MWTLYPELRGIDEVLDEDLRIATVGLGKMGLLHSTILNMLKPGIVKAIVDKSYLITFGGLRLIKNVKFYRDISKMVREMEPDIVYITTPTKSHYSIASQLIEREVPNIFLEKPPTENLRKAYSLLRKCSSNHKLMVGLQKRYSATFRHAKKLVEEKTVGEILSVEAYIKSNDVAAPTNRFDRLGKGVLLDLGVHLVDLIQWIFNVEKVEKAAMRKIYTNVDDHFQASLKLSSGAEALIEVSWSDTSRRLPETYMKIRGEKGIIEVSEDYLKLNLPGSTKTARYRPHYYQGIPQVNLADPEYTLESVHFLHSIRYAKQPLTSLQNTLKTMKIIDELYEKARKPID